MSSVNNNNVPAVYIQKAKSAYEWTAPKAVWVAETFDGLVDKAIPLPFEKPVSNHIGVRAANAGMAVAYAFGALGSFAPFGISLLGDAAVTAAGGAAAALGNKYGQDDIANQGRLAMQTGVVAGGASAASIVVGFASWINVGSYSRAALKSAKAAIWGNAG